MAIIGGIPHFQTYPYKLVRNRSSTSCTCAYPKKYFGCDAPKQGQGDRPTVCVASTPNDTIHRRSEWELMVQWWDANRLCLKTIQYPPILKRGNGKSSINGGNIWKPSIIIHKWDMFYCFVWFPDGISCGFVPSESPIVRSLSGCAGPIENHHEKRLTEIYVANKHAGLSSPIDTENQRRPVKKMLIWCGKAKDSIVETYHSPLFPAPLAHLPIASGNGCCVVVKQPIPKRCCVDNSWDANIPGMMEKNVRHEPVSSCQWCDFTNNGDMGLSENRVYSQL